jgi:curved DNA-binding protein CbpA
MSLNAADVFRTLGIEFKSEQDLESIDDSTVKRQYRKLALKLHPDKNKNDPNAEQKFNQLKAAHDLMMQADKRQQFLLVMKAGFQRQKEREARDVDKRKFAEELERREAEYMHAQSGRVDSSLLRARHRKLVEELQAKRDEAKRDITKLRAGGVSTSTVTGGPDDTNTSLDYWLNFSLNEDEESRRNKSEKFSKFIAQKLEID